MIFSVIGEELGFVGAFAALALIALIIVSIVLVGKKPILIWAHSSATVQPL